MKLHPRNSADFFAQMWLINTSTFQLREFTESTPRYATFCYITDENGASFEDLAQTKANPCKNGIGTIQRACDQARAAGSEWLWNDAACVDKRSSAAVSEAVNSLAQIYRDCEFSMIYLDDLNQSAVDDTLVEKLAECRWTRNVWAIPQIVFSGTSYFYSSGWIRIGDKASLLPHLSSIMGIDQAVLETSDCLEDYSIARRMSWASGMSFSRKEDVAYALLGLFDVSMPIVYGEGRKAFNRLQEEIMKNTDDFSLLAWETLDDQEYNGVFATAPDCFSRFRNGRTTPLRIRGEVQIHCAGITIQASLCSTPSGLFLPLEGPGGPECWVALSKWNGGFVRRGGKLAWNMPGPMSLSSSKVCVKRDVSAHVSRRISASQGLLQQDQPHPLELPVLDGIDAPKGLGCSTMSYDSDDETGSVAPRAEDYGIAPQYASSVTVSEATSRGDKIAWSAHDSVAGMFSAGDSFGRPSGTHETASEAQSVPGECPRAGAEEIESSASCSRQGQEPMNSYGPTTAEMEDLDLSQFTVELARIASEQFLSGSRRESAKRSFAPWQSQNRKRPRLMDSSDHLIVETSDSEDGETVVVNKAKFFACPFYIRDNKYEKCVTRHQLHSIEDVRDHVCWEHRQPRFCPVCRELFSTSKDRDTHIRLRACQPKKSTVEGVTYEQEARLNMEEEKYFSEDLRWFHIWDTIFPRVVRPASPFYTGNRELSVCAFRRFWMQSGEDIVAGFLEEKQLRSYSIRNEERGLKALHDLVLESVVDRIFHDFENFAGVR
ncbi:hypothetical protein diail_12094 [Diaporthe ilicicola]|nr:hypothetical protein diail_12094 [Diaporthe ilicicola]